MDRVARQQSTTLLARHRVIVNLNFIREIPENLDKTKNYYIDYNFFDQQIKYRLDFSNMFQKNNSQYIPLNKIKLFYFFSEDRKGVNHFIKAQNVILSF